MWNLTNCVILDFGKQSADFQFLFTFHQKRRENDFSLEEAATRREEGVKVSVRGVLPGAGGRVHQEVVSDPNPTASCQSERTSKWWVTINLLLRVYQQVAVETKLQKIPVHEEAGRSTKPCMKCPSHKMH